MSVSVICTRVLNQDTYANCIKAQDDGLKRLYIDLTAVEFIDSYSVLELLCAMYQVARVGSQIDIQLPSYTPMRNYVANLGLFDLMPHNVRSDGVIPPRQPPRDQFIPAARIDLLAGEFGIEQLIAFAYPHLPLELAEPFSEALAEVGSNVIHHSEAQEAFVCGQRLDVPYKGRRPPRLHLVVADTGIGVRQSLAQAEPSVAEMTDEEAISKALQPGVTGKPASNSGVGLYTVCEYAQRLGGVLLIRSGSATISFEELSVRRQRTPSVRGTVVSVELPTPAGL